MTLVAKVNRQAPININYLRLLEKKDTKIQYLVSQDISLKKKKGNINLVQGIIHRIIITQEEKCHKLKLGNQKGKELFRLIKLK